MSILDKSTPTQLRNGLNKDLNFQQPNDVTFALNAIRDNHEGGRQDYQSEPGNKSVARLSNGYIIIGTIYGQNDEIYIFSTNSTSSEIGLFKQDIYTALVNDACLSFSWEYPITGEYRVRNGCDRVIYWSDSYNPDRWFNIDKPELFQTSGSWDCNKFRFSPDIAVPNINLIQVNDSGGSLALGSYYFQVEVLDKNENSIYKTDLSPQTVIYDDSQSDAFNAIDGGLNIAQYDAYVGGVPITNKSITLEFSNLDTSFAYLKVNVVRQLNGTQVVDAHSVGQYIPITSDTIQWTYPGFNVNAGDFAVDYSELLIDNIKYDSAYVMEQVQGRLLRANLKQDIREYGNYQIFASEIRAQWVSDVVEANNAKALGNPKNPNTYWYKTTFQGDEIQAFGIRYLHSDGTWSPVFHIPGRAAISSDLDLLTVVDNTAVLGTNEVWVSDIEHLPDSEFTVLTNTYVGSTIERWRVFNTATRTFNFGTMGYYECDTTYPDIRDCNDALIWGNDYDGNPITTSTKIRHHRFPDRKLLPHYNGTSILPYGVMFDNITYPSSDVVAHQWCVGNQSEFDKTVLDSGWAGKPPVQNSTLNLEGYMGYEIGLDGDQPYIRYNSAELLSNKKLFNTEYLKVNRAYHLDSTPAQFPSAWAPYPITDLTVDKTLYMNVYHMKYNSDATLSRENFKLLKQVYVPAQSFTGNTDFPVNIDDHRQKLTDDSIIQVNYNFESLGFLGSQSFGILSADPSVFILNNYYLYKKINNKPFSNIFTIRYEYLNYNPIYGLTLNDNIVFNGNSIISLNNVSREVGQFSSSSSQEVREFISYTYMYEEHPINMSLRHGGNSADTTYYKNDEGNVHFLNKMADLNENSRWVIRTDDQWRKEYYAYNKDYDVQTVEQTKSQLPFNYDYCASCSGVYTHRIVFSPKSFDEENFDLYRVTKVNDYIDLPGHRGAITGIKYQNNQLLVHTEDTTFILQPNPQQISTDQNTAYLTTGDFLSIPPQELLQTDIGFAGCQSKQSQTDTPFGHCWADQKRGEIFAFSNQLEVLSQHGLTQWCKENLPSETVNAIYKEFQLPYQFNTTFNPYGRGLILYYDPRFKRLLITKKDYLPIDFHKYPTASSQTTYEYEDRIWEYYDGTNTIAIDYGDSIYFENKSWTLSYSFPDQSFTSWHSYIPNHGFADSDNFYTTNNSRYIWKHLHKENYQKFYGDKKDFIIEFVIVDGSTTTLDTIHYVGYTHQWDNNKKVFKPIDDITFNKLMCYNNYHNTGIVTLSPINQSNNPYGNVSLGSFTKAVIKTDDNYKVSGLYDMTIASPAVSMAWGDIRPEFPIDLVAANIDFNKSQYDWGNITGKYIYVRLYFKPDGDYRKQINLVQTNELYSIR